MSDDRILEDLSEWEREGLRRRRYEPHPDRNQEALVYSLLAELVDAGEVTRHELVEEMAADHIRHDSIELIDRYRGWQLLDAVA